MTEQPQVQDQRANKMPAGIGNILVNETAERFAFYGTRAILVLYMTQALLNGKGQLDPMGDETAKAWMHWFIFGVYAFPVVGAVLSDAWLAKYRTILWFSGLYCFGFAALVLDQTRLGLLLGLFLISLGSGIIKPCVSANVGDQFTKRNQHLISRVYNWFYFAINVGAWASMFFIPIIRDRVSFRAGFAVCGAMMVVATVAFWTGRRKYNRVPAGGSQFLRETLDREGLSALGRLSIIFLFVVPFWSLFDQTTSAWVLQAENMDLHWLGYTWLPDQLTSVNSALILIMIPLFSYVIYPAVSRVFPLTPLRKISIGLFVTAGSFMISAWIESLIVGGLTPSIGWQVLAYVVITAGEIMVSITCLEFAYTQAPKRMKSFIMSVFLLSIAAGNAFTAIVNMAIRHAGAESRLQGPAYYWFFAWVMLGTAVCFVVVAMLYKEKTYILDEESREEKSSEAEAEIRE